MLCNSYINIIKNTQLTVLVIYWSYCYKNDKTVGITYLRLCKPSHLLFKIGSDELYNTAGICAKCMVESI